MSLVINHNLMAMNAARNLSTSYGKLSTSVQRMSSGLRINSAADDAAGLAIREMMRADIAVMQQGLRNAADAISLIQTADGALAVIDEKLIRMKELAEQAATGTYTTAQRDIINSEYQAMAREIDRIANSTNFNGVKLLDGSLATQNGGRGMKVHFGAGNNPAEDYYFIGIADVRATTATGLRVGGDGQNDIWAQGGAAQIFGGTAGCCAGGYETLTGASFSSGDVFSFGYNWDLKAESDTELAGGKYTAGLWVMQSGASLADLVAQVNQGTQARVGVKIDSLVASDLTSVSAVAVCFGNEIYALGNDAVANIVKSANTGKSVFAVGATTNQALVTAINSNSESSFWAVYDSTDGGMAYVFSKDGGGTGNGLVACEQAFGKSESATALASALNKITFANVSTGVTGLQDGANFSLGGEMWGTLAAGQIGTGGQESWNIVLNGRDVGDNRNLRIANLGGTSTNSTLDKANLQLLGATGLQIGRFLDRGSFAEVQNAADPNWDGAEIRTQDSAQKAMEVVNQAIERKDKARAVLGTYQTRLENTMAALEIQAENLQAAESRISDADVAREIVDFTRNSVLIQAGTSMVAQANSLSNLALTLLR